VAWLRAVLLTALVALSTLATVPTFGTASAERLQRPFEQAELERWQAMLSGLGLELSREQLAELYLGFASRVAEVRAAVQAPLRWWTQLTQTEPGWMLFGTPDAFSPAFRLHAWDGNGERVLCESADPERRWQASLLGYRRLRAAYNPSRSGPPPTYPGLCQRLSERIFAELPAVERIRCSILRRAVPVPGEPAQRAPEEQHVIEIARVPG
jgi:hypothetical protein